MKIKAFVKTLDGLDDKFHHLYEKTEDGYILQVEDTDYKSKLEEFKKLEERAATAEKATEKYKSQLNTKIVNDLVTKAITDNYNVAQGAMTDILSRATKTWQVGDDGKLVATDSRGNIRYGKDSKDLLTLKEWVADLKREAPFLFEPNSDCEEQGSGTWRTFLSDHQTLAVIALAILAVSAML